MHQPATDRETGRTPPLLWIGIALFVLYLLLVGMRPVGVFWSLDEGGKLLYLQNVLATGDPSAPLLYPGRNLDPELRYIPLFFWSQSGDQIYSWWPVAFPLMTLPFYAVLGWFGLYLLPAFGGALSAVLSGAIARTFGDVREREAVGIALIVGLATPVLFYSTMFWEHVVSVAALLLSVWLAIKSGQRAWLGWPIAAGVAGALAGFLRTEQLFGTAGVVLVLLLWRWRAGMVMGGAAAVTLGVGLTINRMIMGAFLSRQWGENSAQLTSDFFPGWQEAGNLYLPFLLFNAPKIEAYELSLPLLTIGTMLVVLCLVFPFVRRLWWWLVLCYVALAVLCAWVLIQPIGYRTVHGLVVIAPHIVLFPWLLREIKVRPPSRWLVLSVALPSALILGAYIVRSWLAAGGQQWGSRYLLALYPLLTVMAVVGLRKVQAQATARLWHGLLAGLCLLVLVGVGFEVRGQQAAWATTHNYQRTLAALEADTTTPKLTDCIWLPMVIPELYWRGDFFARHDWSEDLDVWTAYLGKQGVHTSWFVKMDMCLDEPLDTIATLRRDNPTGLTIEGID